MRPLVQRGRANLYSRHLDTPRTGHELSTLRGKSFNSIVSMLSLGECLSWDLTWLNTPAVANALEMGGKGRGVTQLRNDFPPAAVRSSTVNYIKHYKSLYSQEGDARISMLTFGLSLSFGVVERTETCFVLWRSSHVLSLVIPLIF